MSFWLFFLLLLLPVWDDARKALRKDRVSRAHFSATLILNLIARRTEKDGTGQDRGSASLILLLLKHTSVYMRMKAMHGGIWQKYREKNEKRWKQTGRPNDDSASDLFPNFVSFSFCNKIPSESNYRIVFIYCKPTVINSLWVVRRRSWFH